MTSPLPCPILAHMILIDSRIGSGDLAPRIAASPGAPEVELTRLEFGDIAFAGSGPDGDALIGIEIKTITDLVNCIMDGRYAAHQLPGMIDTYSRVYTLVEGQYRGNKDTGALETPRVKLRERNGRNVWGPVWRGKKEFSYDALQGWIASIEEFAGVKFRYTTNRFNTVNAILDLYHWWQKDYDSHKSLKVFHDKPKPAVSRRSITLTNCIEQKPTLTMLFAKDMAGLGWERAGAVSEHFGNNPRRMVNASKEEWLEIDGIGETLAERIDKALDGDQGA